MTPLAKLTDKELIDEHRWRWNAWMKRRVQFGELGATGDERMIDLEGEAVEREIPESVLLEGCIQSLNDVQI